MSKREETRQFWTDLVCRYEKEGQPQKAFASDHQVGVAALRYWICKLGREAKAPSMRLLPVRIAHHAAARPEPTGRLEVRLDGLSIRVPIGVDPQYLARVVAAMRAPAC